MKIIVDEMPKVPSECILSRLRHDDWVCSKYEGCICNVDTCDLLKPITDYVFEERVAENITKRIQVKDTNVNR